MLYKSLCNLTSFLIPSPISPQNPPTVSPRFLCLSMLSSHSNAMQIPVVSMIKQNVQVLFITGRRKPTLNTMPINNKKMNTQTHNLIIPYSTVKPSHKPYLMCLGDKPMPSIIHCLFSFFPCPGSRHREMI